MTTFWIDLGQTRLTYSIHILGQVELTHSTHDPDHDSYKIK